MQFSTIIRLSKEEKIRLRKIVDDPVDGHRVQTRAHILLDSNEGIGRECVAHMQFVSPHTVQRVRDRYREGGLEYALYESKRSGAPKKLSKQGEEYLVQLLNTQPPAPHLSWTLDLLKKKMVEVKLVANNISLPTISSYLKKANKRSVGR